MADKSAATESFDQYLSKQRIDYEQLPDGTVAAILTVTLPGGQQMVFTGETTSEEAQVVSGFYDEIAYMEREGLIPYGQVGFSLGGLFKGIAKSIKSVVLHPINVIKNPKNLFKPPDLPIFNKQFQAIHKKIDNVAKKVATSKAFKTAAAGLMTAAPFLGPVAPFALAAGGAMTVAGKVMQARVAAEKGAKGAAELLTKQAVEQAKTLAPKNFQSLLAIGNDKAKAAMGLANAKAPKQVTTAARQALKTQITRKGGPAPMVRAATGNNVKKAIKPKKKGPALLPESAARAALLQGKLSPQALINAARTGRVYVVTAS